MTSAEQAQELQELAAREQNASVAKLVIALASRKSWLLKGGLCLAIPVAALQFSLHRVYTAQALVMPPAVGRSSTSILPASSSGADLAAIIGGGSPLQPKLQTDTFVSLMGVRPVEDIIIKRFDLVKEFQAKDNEEAAKTLQAETSIVGTKQGFIQVLVTDSDPARSARLANAYPDALQEFMTGLSLTEASNRRVFYGAQLARSKNELANAELKFKQMQQSSHMIALDSQAKSLLEEAGNLNSQIRAKQVELQQLRSYSTDANAQVQILQTQIGALRGQLEQVESRSSSSSFTGSALSNVPGAEIEYIRVARELKYQEGMYEVMVRQYETSILDEAKEAPSAQVLEPALVPQHASGPHRLLNTLYAFVFGVFLGLAFSLARFFKESMGSESRGWLTSLRTALFSW